MEEKNQEFDYYTLTDENGNETEYELIGTCEMNGNKYVILKLEKEENGEEFLVSVDDDDEFDDVADYFDDYLAEEIDYDDNTNN